MEYINIYIIDTIRIRGVYTRMMYIQEEIYRMNDELFAPLIFQNSYMFGYLSADLSMYRLCMIDFFNIRKRVESVGFR